MIDNDILFRRSMSVVVPTDTNYSTLGVGVFSTAIRELANLGYRPSGELLNAMVSHSDPVGFLSEVISIVSKAVGANFKYVPMYPNFPKQVMEASDAELYFNAILHYFGDWIGARIMPEYEVKDRKPLEAPKFDDLKVIELTSVTDYTNILVRLLGSKTSWSETDQSDVTILLGTVSGFSTVGTVKAVPNKENLAFLAKHDLILALALAGTATDVLRIAVVLSGGDPALNGVGVEKVRFKSLPKATRRAFVARLSDFPNLTEDALRNMALWKLFFHSLHVGDFAKKYPKVAESASIVRNNGKDFLTFNGQIEKSLTDGDFKTTLTLLTSRPGDFARRLDKVIRETSGAPELTKQALKSFASVASKVSTPVLWQLRAFYENRSLIEGYYPELSRVFMPKGRATKMLEAAKPLPLLHPIVVENVISIIDQAILENYVDKMLSGSVYIAPELFDCTIPFGARSASKSLNPVGRGTRVSLGDENVVRMFIHWKDIDSGDDWGSRVDVDLSAYSISKNFDNASTVSYYNLREGSWGIHSGDITSAPEGSAEFIDIDKKAAIAAGHRYIAMTINSYSGQKFDTIPELFAGVMGRVKKQSGEIFEPRTVQNAFDVSTSGTMVMPFVIDLIENVMIWSDLEIGRGVMYSNVANSENPLLRSIKGIVQTNQPTLGDLLKSHTTTLTDSREDADHVFTFNRGRVVHNDSVVGQEEILAEWL